MNTALAQIFLGSALSLAAFEAASACQNPVDTGRGRNRPPAAHANAAVPDYYELKASKAFWVAARIGLDVMRARCPRSHAWIEKWELRAMV